jgi:phosphoribosylanthranilate isomerase
VAVSHGADAIGLVFYPPSPRFIEIDAAAEIVRSLPAFVTCVGLFVNADQQDVTKAIELTGINLLQFHGNECPDYCAGFDFPYIKALRMKEDVDLLRERERYASAKNLLLDTYIPGAPGGTGESFNWERIPQELAPEIILAGGLGPENVDSAIATVQPYAVDVSGGVESSKGVKSAEKIEQFMRGVSIADK